jgi:hypothetical protein
VLFAGDNFRCDIKGPPSCGMQAVLVRPGGLRPGETLPGTVPLIRHFRELPAPLAAAPAEPGQSPGAAPQLACRPPDGPPTTPKDDPVTLEFDIVHPHPARVYDHLLDGKDNISQEVRPVFRDHA